MPLSVRSVLWMWNLLIHQVLSGGRGKTMLAVAENKCCAWTTEFTSNWDLKINKNIMVNFL
jgi:hypothetical protein